MKGWIIAILTAAIFGAGFYLGSVWSAHQHDAHDLVVTRNQLNAAQHALDKSATDWQSAIKQFRSDRAALDAFAQEYADAHVARTHYFGILNDRLTRMLAARRGAADCDIGPDGLRNWNAANRGDTAVAAKPVAGAAHRPIVIAAMPAIATREKRQAAGPASQPPADHAALPRLRESARRNHPGGAQARGDRGTTRGGSGNPRHASRIALIEGTPL